ncbi:MAG: hypothetical protein K8S99_11135 [Planctomycetes bacterium]|nr:hypothetical protein [Planctomycetota bacterium]
MNQDTNGSSKINSGPIVVVWGLVLVTFAMIMAIIAAILFRDPAALEWSSEKHAGWAALVAVAFVLAVLGAVVCITGAVRWALAAMPTAELTRQVRELRGQLAMIDERLQHSDAAKRIIYREKDRDAMRRAIREDISKKEFESAMVMVTQMGQVYGYRQEAEDLREEVMRARASDLEAQINQSLAGFEKMLVDHEWDRAVAEAAKIQRLFPDSLKVRDLSKRAREARELYKHSVERQFLQAAERDDVELAMELLKELDKYLTEAEAGPFREVARGVIGKKRQNLGVQFKLAVQDKEWMQAVRVGEQVIREFPNTKMSDEVRGMLDLLRERAAGEQAARQGQTA